MSKCVASAKLAKEVEEELLVEDPDIATATKILKENYSEVHRRNDRERDSQDNK